jgi:uncharacterized protein (TIGR00162 family)
MDSEVRFLLKPEMKTPILIGGLPGVGQVGKLASEFLISELAAQRIAEQLSPHFPHYTILEKDGILRASRHDFYWARVEGKDLIILTGDCPITTPEGHYEVASKILEAMEVWGVKEIYMLGGVIFPTKSKGTPKVIIVPNHPDSSYKPSKIDIGPVVGLTGLLVSLARVKGIRGACLLAEAGDPVVDTHSAKLLLQTLSDLLGLKLDLSTLEKQALVLREWVEKMRKEMKRREPPQPEETWYIG